MGKGALAPPNQSQAKILKIIILQIFPDPLQVSAPGARLSAAPPPQKKKQTKNE